MLYNLTGGGAPLNINVKAYASENALLDESANENTIGVVTTTAITSWVFSESAPGAPVAGMVWFVTGTGSGFTVNALKKNGVMVRPRLTRQYISGAWKTVTGYIRQNSEWHILGTFLFKDGDITQITGGWEPKNGSSWAALGSYSVDDTIEMSTPDYQHLIWVKQKNLINLTDFNYLYVNAVSAREAYVAVHAQDSTWAQSAGTIRSEVINSAQLVKLDISGLSGSYYVGLSAYGEPGNLSADEVYLA